MNRKLISVCIPTYEMHGFGHVFLKQNLDILARQTLKDFEVVISDHSRDDKIQELCVTYPGILDIKYYRNKDNIGNSSANINHAIRKATGKLVKILFQDDFLRKDDALSKIATNFDLNKDHWQITACASSLDGKTFFRPFYPRYHPQIHLGPNTISSPSVVTIINDNPLFFDEKLIWYMDCDYYKRYYDAFGQPKIVNEILVVNRVGPHQVSHTLATEAIKEAEFKYILRKYKVRQAWFRLLLRKFRAYKARP